MSMAAQQTAEFVQACTAILEDNTLALWERVGRIEELALLTLAPYSVSCDITGCTADAVYCADHGDEITLACDDCGADVPRVLCADCHAEKGP